MEYIFYLPNFMRYVSFMKRQTSDTSSDNAWQPVATNGKTIDNEWLQVTTYDKSYNIPNYDITNNK